MTILAIKVDPLMTCLVSKVDPGTRGHARLLRLIQGPDDMTVTKVDPGPEEMPDYQG
jgi:hypothetical protein